ncbi:MAG: hypothetical protein GF347_02435 [Candidatus Moranbacteria bacterium]|nr:hypothetical protein [Candidatus Moranbacteria bacterium]
MENLKEKFIKNHVSTKEREPFRLDFNNQIAKYLDETETILDLGSGLYPLMFPFDKAPKLKRYICFEKDEIVGKILLEFAKALPKIKFEVYGQFAKKPDFKNLLENKSRFDLVLMLKFIPVIERRTPNLLKPLSKIPAQKIILTASKEALTKRQKIEKRERKTLIRFIKSTGREIVDQIEIENEFGFVI